MVNAFKERRSFVRFARILPLKFLNLDTNKEGQALTHDISAKGIGFVTDLALVPKTNIEIWLYIPDDKEPVYAQGKVIWSDRVASNTYRVGVDLEKVDFIEISRILRTN